MQDTLKEQIKKIVNEIIPGADDVIILYDHGLDSIKVIQLISKLEKEFDIVFTNAEINAANFKTVNDIFSIIKSKKEHA
jgi:acyl carrier protein